MGSEFDKAIGERVRRARKKKHLSLETVSQSLPVKISFQMLAQYENGVSRWPAGLLSDIADILRVDIRKLLGKI